MAAHLTTFAMCVARSQNHKAAVVHTIQLGLAKTLYTLRFQVACVRCSSCNSCPTCFLVNTTLVMGLPLLGLVWSGVIFSLR